MSTTQTYIGTLVVIQCGECGVAFGVVEEFCRQRREDHHTFYCPNGHSRWYPGESGKERELRLAKESAVYYRERSERSGREAETAKRQAAAARGMVTRIKKRVAKGVCPACNRTFGDLARHMSGQHPDFANADGPPKER